ncbi:MAG: nicotinate (nicotinamide) nucleotide adenylyltransferase [Chitinophagaceae bacterium]|nr:nicotinate (nicotinamide) nucleotide adenylyltransferase [Chitinophagaceae bacterium]
MKVGLYFGSFNPVHHGHLIIANFVAWNTDLSQVWFVVSPQNPFKTESSLLNEYHRYHLVQLAIENESKLRATDIEFRLPKPSYTINTLTYLEEKYPENQFCIIMGSDSYQNLHKWKNAEVLMQRYPVYVYKRPGFEITKQAVAALTVLEAPLLQISATHIRKMVGEGKPIRYLVPDSVKDEIERNHYYR